MSRNQRPRYKENFVPEHGTKNGYDWHRRGAFEDPCIPCREAMMAYWVNERKKKPRNSGKRAKEWGALHKPYTYEDVLIEYGQDCHICHKPIDLDAPRRVGIPGWERGLHLDHVLPLSKGGEDTLENVKPAHGKCNIIKSATYNKE